MIFFFYKLYICYEISNFDIKYVSFFSLFANDHKSDTADLDDIKLYDIVKVEHCLDQAYDTIPGHARKLEFKIEGDDPIYEFDIESINDGHTYNVECNAEEGFIVEVEKEVSADNKMFKEAAKISIDQARSKVLKIHPGTIVNERGKLVWTVLSLMNLIFRLKQVMN